jgi:hypothetical protein
MDRKEHTLSMTREQRLVSLRPEAPKTKGTSHAATRRTNAYEGLATFDARMRALREHEIQRAKSLAERRLPLMACAQLLAMADRRALAGVEIDGEPVTVEEIKALGDMISGAARVVAPVSCARSKGPKTPSVGARWTLAPTS